MRPRATKRSAGAAALCGMVLVASAGLAGNAGAADAPAAGDLVALPQGIPPGDQHGAADILVTIKRDPKETVKNGTRYVKLTFTVKSSAPMTNNSSGAYYGVTAPYVTLQATVRGEDDSFRKVPNNCAILVDSKAKKIGCVVGRLDYGKSATIPVEVALTGTAHAVNASAKNDSGKLVDTNDKNNNAVTEWTTAKPQPKPSPKPSTKTPEPEKPSSKPPKPSCAAAVVEYSKDNGRTWSRSGQLREFSGKLKVRLAGKVADSCRYTISYASYDTEGPTWKKSGKLTYLAKDTVTLTGKKPTGELDIAKHLPKCYGQVVLYGNGTKFDGSGKKNPLPKYEPGAKPNAPTNLLASWNGGKACAPKQPTTSGKPSGSPSKSPPKSTSASASASSSESESRTASASSSESASPSVPQSPSESQSPTESTTPSETPTASASETPTATTTQTATTQPTGPGTDAPAPPQSPAPPAANQQNVPQTPVEVDEQQSVAEAPTAPGTLPKTGAGDRLPYLIALAVCSILLGLLGYWWTGRRREA
ncbi:MAG: LPXTG cell wall anchor domain-containing protein [Streptomycetaceae bacterium]|nr:LPXTG cell wall anchor domain-containing protein [Streptomycetaceae bacterium]